jgi:protein associated with RNAse G/E
MFTERQGLRHLALLCRAVAARLGSLRRRRHVRLRLVATREVRVVYTKYDGSLHWHHVMQHLGEDEHGVWLGARAGLVTQRGSEPPIVIEAAHVLLVPDGTWWTANFNAEPAFTEVYCDITTPPQWPEEDQVTMVDLDLDVVRRADQRVLLLDEDEFAEHQVRYSYPTQVISQAVESARWLQEAVTAGAEPFAAAFRRWLDQVS